MLPNGLTVLVYRNTTAPVVAIETYVSAGYLDETDDIVGIAHVLEHMFFKGHRHVASARSQSNQRGRGYSTRRPSSSHEPLHSSPVVRLPKGLEVQADA